MRLASATLLLKPSGAGRAGATRACPTDEATDGDGGAAERGAAARIAAAAAGAAQRGEDAGDGGVKTGCHACMSWLRRPPRGAQRARRRLAALQVSRLRQDLQRLERHAAGAAAVEVQVAGPSRCPVPWLDRAQGRPAAASRPEHGISLAAPLPERCPNRSRPARCTA